VSAAGDRPASAAALSTQRFQLEALEPRLLLSATPTEVVVNQVLEPAAITVPAGSLPNLDVDLNLKTAVEVVANKQSQYMSTI
jgi:hypothetical protein